ncbi:MAG TPA: hypothetical protein VGB22_03110 [candidate division Zixibacteria bacterium]|jgi:hypothetical protein
MKNFREWFESRNPRPTETPLSAEEDQLMTRLADKVVQWKMTVPAILFLESVKPLNYVGAQALVFFEPFVQTIFNFKEYDTFRIMMERRENMERLLQRIEQVDAEALERERAARRVRRRSGRSWWKPFGKGSRDTTGSGEAP